VSGAAQSGLSQPLGPAGHSVGVSSNYGASSSTPGCLNKRPLSAGPELVTPHSKNCPRRISSEDLSPHKKFQRADILEEKWPCDPSLDLAAVGRRTIGMKTDPTAAEIFSEAGTEALSAAVVI
jgi:hypothetical protein